VYLVGHVRAVNSMGIGKVAFMGVGTRKNFGFSKT
jgi:hypothetical protein